MKHLVLCGDSIFDNKAYTNGGADVITHLRQQMPADWRATLRAVDGNVVEDVRGQLANLPADTSHLFISAGGNNALLNADLLQGTAQTTAEVFAQLAERGSTFAFHYERMLQEVLRLGIPTTVCTIYYPNVPEPFLQKITTAALATFNDVIIKSAFAAGFPLIDLRLVCNEPTDYANEIEPSVRGGEKIAQTILRVVREYDFRQRRTMVFF